MAKGIGALMPRQTQLPFKIVDNIAYDPAATDLTVEVSKAKAANADFLVLVCRLNDAIILRREMVKQRWNPMGIVSPGSPGMYEEQYFKTLGKLSEYSVSNVPWYNPNAKLTRLVEKAFLKQNPKDKLVFHGLNAGFTFEAILIAADAFKRAQRRSEDPRGRDPPDQHHRQDDAGRPDQVQRERAGRGHRLGLRAEPEPDAHGGAARVFGHGEARLPDARIQKGVVVV